MPDLLLFFLYDDEIVGTMLAAEIIYLVITPPVLWNLKKKTEIRLEPMVSVAEKNQDIPVIVQVKNQSRWFPVHVRVRIMIENTFTGKKKKYVLRGSVMPGKKEFLKVFFGKNSAVISKSP